MLEDESTATANEMQVLFHEKILPDLSKNIVCGNSLIGTDILQGKMFPSEEERKLNPMDFETTFPEIMKNGGFDAIVGNPPYVKEDVSRESFVYVKKSKLSKYYQGKMDLWYFFISMGIDLLKINGLLGYIAINNWNTNYGAKNLRNKIINDTRILKYFDFNDFKVFKDASIQTMVLILEKYNSIPERYLVDYYKIIESKISSNLISEYLINKIENEQITNYNSDFNPSSNIDKPFTFVNNKTDYILKKIKSNANYYFDNSFIGNGIDVLQDFVSSTHLSYIKDKTVKKGDGIFVLSKQEIDKLNLSFLEKEYLKPYYTSAELQKYYYNNSNSYYIIYANEYFRKNINLFPNLKNHLNKFKEVMTSVFKPYGLHRAREQRFFEEEKILSLRKTKTCSFTYTDNSCYVSRAFLIIKPNNINQKYLLSLLNSSLINFWLYNKGKKQGEQLQVDKGPLLQIPLIKTDMENETKIVSLVEQMLEAKKQLQNAKTDRDKTYYERRCNDLDSAIDSEVYKLYGLTEEEIKIVENN